VAADVALIDINGDGYVDYAYVADVGGNIYRVNLVDRSVAANGTVTYAPLAASSWTITRVASTTGAGRKFLFAPELLASANKVYIGIGSGDREHPLAANYPYANVLNRFYVYLDDPSRTSAISLDADLVDYTNQSVVASIIAANGNSCTATTAFTNTKYGWRIDLNQFGQGEQTVTSAVIVGGMVTFSTNRPIPTASGQCSTILGEARGYFLNLLNASGAISPSCYINGTYQASQTCTCGGTRSATFAGGGLPPSPVIGTVPVNGVPQTVVIGAVQRGGGGSSPIAPQQVNPPIQSKRKNVYRYTTGTDNK
jgi:Tfp pilus tip-associated adhesin PilY1